MELLPEAEKEQIGKSLFAMIKCVRHYHYSRDDIEVERIEVDEIKATIQILVQTVDRLARLMQVDEYKDR